MFHPWGMGRWMTPTRSGGNVSLKDWWELTEGGVGIAIKTETVRVWSRDG